MSKYQEKMRAVVIGSGFGGLSSAIRLQAKGFQVTLLEKREKLGGRAYQLKKNGYTFDMGPSLVTAPEIISRVFEAAGRNMHDYLDMVRLEPAYRIYFHDGTHIDYGSDSEEMKSQMAKFNQKDADNYDRFISQSSRFYEAVINEGLGSMPFADMQTMFRFLPKAMKLNALWPAYNYVSRYFDDFRHRFTFSFHPLFIGGNPFRSPSLYLMIPYLEKTGGVWFTTGGMYSVVEAFASVFNEIGGQVVTEAEVTGIDVQNGKAVGVSTADAYYPADIVVSNADFRHTYHDLVDKKDRKKWNDNKLEKLDYSMSAFLLYIGTRRQYPQLLHHTLILSERYKGLVDDIFDNKVLPDDFSMYLHAPTRTDAGMAPEGCESMYVLIPVANMKADIDWDAIKQKYTDKIIDFLEHDFGMEDLRENIDVLEIFTPKDFLTTQNAHLGSAWGVEPKLMQTAYFRPHNRSEDIPNMYLVGASTHPGAGVPGVLLTAEATERAIMEDFKLPEAALTTQSA